jgi:hypothetical protein
MQASAASRRSKLNVKLALQVNGMPRANNLGFFVEV